MLAFANHLQKYDLFRYATCMHAHYLRDLGIFDHSIFSALIISYDLLL
jgi:hypothetical protein